VKRTTRAFVPIAAAIATMLAACGGRPSPPPNDVSAPPVSKEPQPAPCARGGKSIGPEEAFGRRIASICVSGASPGVAKAILKELALGADATLTVEALREDLGRVWATGLVDDLEADVSANDMRVDLEIVVRESPLIADVTITGAAPITGLSMKGELEAAPLKRFRVRNVQSVISRARARYVEMGFHRADVKWQATALPGNRVRLLVTIVEGPRSTGR
jgi:outer membrane protein assembly factor BamA